MIILCLWRHSEILKAWGFYGGGASKAQRGAGQLQQCRQRCGAIFNDSMFGLDSEIVLGVRCSSGQSHQQVPAPSISALPFPAISCCVLKRSISLYREYIFHGMFIIEGGSGWSTSSKLEVSGSHCLMSFWKLSLYSFLWLTSVSKCCWRHVKTF